MTPGLQRATSLGAGLLTPPMSAPKASGPGEDAPEDLALGWSGRVKRPAPKSCLLPIEGGRSCWLPLQNVGSLSEMTRCSDSMNRLGSSSDRSQRGERKCAKAEEAGG